MPTGIAVNIHGACGYLRTDGLASPARVDPSGTGLQTAERYIVYDAFDTSSRAALRPGAIVILYSQETQRYCRLASAAALGGVALAHSNPGKAANPPPAVVGSLSAAPASSTTAVRPLLQALNETRGRRRLQGGISGRSLPHTATSQAVIVVQPQQQQQTQQGGTRGRALPGALVPETVEAAQQFASSFRTKAPPPRKAPPQPNKSSLAAKKKAPPPKRASARRAPPPSIKARPPPPIKARPPLTEAGSKRAPPPRHVLSHTQPAPLPQQTKALPITSKGANATGLLCDAMYVHDATALELNGLGFSYHGSPLLPTGVSQALAVTPGGDPAVCSLDTTIGEAVWSAGRSRRPMP